MSNPESPSTASPSGTAFNIGQKLAGVYVLRQQATPPDAASPIWLAYDEVLGKDVSLHFVPEGVRADARAMNDLRQEIKRNRQLIHPNILRVYDLIEESDWAAISMDWFEGESVAALQKQKEGGFFESADVKPWLQQLLPALDDVHKIHLVHRNISPPNLFIEKSGKLLVANFGISRVMEDALGRAQNQGENVERHVVYMSPQQLDGETPTKADDLYSVGVTLYELLSGQAPFAEGDLVPQIRKTTPEPMMDRRAKLGKRGGTILPVWEKTVAACLAKNAAERPQSAADVASKLGVAGKGSAIEAPAMASAVARAEKSEPGPKPAASRLETVKESEPAGTAGKKSQPAAPVQKPAPAPQHAPARSYAEIAAAVAADEREASGKELAGKGHDGGAEADEGPDIYPSAYPPRRSKFPTMAAVLAAIAVLGGGYYLFFGRSSSDQDDKSDSQPSAQNLHESTPVPIDQPPPKSQENASTDHEQPAVAGDTGPKSPQTPQTSGDEHPRSSTPPAVVKAPPDGGDSKAPGPLIAANPTPTPSKEGGSASVAVPQNQGTQYTEVRTRPRDAKATPAPATPAPATPAPVSEAAVGAKGPEIVAILDPTAPVAKLQDATAALEKKAQDLKRQQQLAEAAAADSQKLLDEKKKAAALVLDAAKDLTAQRHQREEQVKSTELSAQQARQAAEEKSRLASDAKKALSDWETANHSKLAASETADADLQNLQKALADKQRAAADAAKQAVDAESARQQQAGVLQKAMAAAQESAAKAKAEQQAKLDAELKKVEDMRRGLEEQINKIKAMQNALGKPGADLSSPGSGAPLPAPAGNGSQNTDPKNPLPPIASTTPPPHPPRPQPLPAASPIGAPPPDPALVLAMRSTPAPLVLPHIDESPPVKSPEAPAPEAPTVFENSLGMKFAPVGDVLFCIWPTRVKDYEVFASEAGPKLSNAWRRPGYKQGPDHPVVYVNWNDAMAFCKWLQERDRKKGILTEKQIYRLPTDLEWSKAVGLPEETGRTPEARDMGVPDVFPWGSQWPPPPNVGNYTGEETGSDVAISGYDDGFAWTAPVGSFPPNKYGLYDVGGNVWQWCMDSWSEKQKAKVLRGGSWYNALKLSLLSSCRMNEDPEKGTDNYGFRIVRAADSGKPKEK